MLPTSLSKKIQSHLSALSSFCWAPKSGIRYLGIQLTSPSSLILNKNYDSLLRNIRSQLLELSKLHISWVGRAAVTKMSILPTILYHFRTLPMPLTNLYLQNLQASIMSSWLYSQSRLHKKIPVVYQSMPLSTLEYFDLSLVSWSEAGAMSIGHLLDNSNLLTYEDLRKRFCLPQSDFYKYLCVQ